MGIPDFAASGILPAGIHQVGWRAFVEKFGFNSHRQKLIRGLQEALSILSIAGCKRLYVDGSFVTNKEVPMDYDAAWEPKGVDLDLLLMMEPVFGIFDNGRLAQKLKFGGEFFPSSISESGSGKTFLEFFQFDKETGSAKGIIALNPEGTSDD